MNTNELISDYEPNIRKRIIAYGKHIDAAKKTMSISFTDFDRETGSRIGYAYECWRLTNLMTENEIQNFIDNKFSFREALNLIKGR